MFKKAQAAMEFLMTYGWAILVVLIVLAALFYLGIFTPKTPNICIVGAPLTCADVKAEDANNKVTLVLASSGTQSATLEKIILFAPINTWCQPSPNTISISAPTSISCTVNNPVVDLVAGQKYIGIGNVTYQLLGSTETHITQVQFSGVVE